MRTSATRQWLAVTVAVARRPVLWREAVRQALLLAPRRRRAWLRFRLTTAYGDPDQSPDAADVVVWLAWSRNFRHALRH